MRNRRGRSRGMHPSESEYSSDDEQQNWENEEITLDENIGESQIEIRARNYTNKPTKYNTDYSDEEEVYGTDAIIQSLISKTQNKIEHIFMSRETLSGVEYLVILNSQSDPFAQWIPQPILTEFSNYERQLQKFNETDMKFSFYFTCDHHFTVSYSSPLHIISHRPMGNTLEYLYQLNVETGTAFYWEPQNADSPANLIDHYMKTRVKVVNTHPPRPEYLSITNPKEFSANDGSEPRDYQITGVNWLLACFSAEHGSILADEMGLGKTIQTLIFLSFLNKHTDFHGPHLIAVRTNTFNQWCAELENWSDLRYIAYTGQPNVRNMMQEYQMKYYDDSGRLIDGTYPFNILLVTYDIFLKDVDVMEKIDWQCVIVDEGHRIKNCDGKKHNALVRIPSMHRVILTGTPIQNTMFELWTLLQFVSPKYFPNSDVFTDDDVESLDKDVLAEMKRMIAPHIMRRSLIDVERTVVPKDERIAFLQVTRPQRELMRLTKMHELWRLRAGSETEAVHESNMMQRICNHPFLVDGAEQWLMGGGEESKLHLMVNCSAKFIFLDRILPIFKRTGRSVLIFSQKVKVLKLLSEYCHLRKYTHEMLIGQLTDTEKRSAITSFCDTDKDVFIFLISTRSGAEGLNLTKANITIIFDPDWNPQNDIQALGRCHRIGQTQKVDVIRLLTYGTYEHEMYVRSQRKMKLWMTLLGDGGKIEAAREKPKIETEQQKTFQDSMICPHRREDTAEFEGFGSVKDIIREEEQEVEAPLGYGAPPDLKMGFEPPDGATFEDVMEASSTVVRDIPLATTTAKNFPAIDLTAGESATDFLARFPASSPSIGTQKKQNKRVQAPVRVALDPKTAKRIIRQMEVHGYGEWDTIYHATGCVIPVEQLMKFCKAATILHLRACEPSRVAGFPLLLYRLSKDVPGFEVPMVYCREPGEWYSVFSKRMALSGDAAVCKHISNHIAKTAVPFLSKLEHHLVIEEWRQEISKDFEFDHLPPHDGRTRKMDEQLLSDIVMGNEIPSKDNERVAQILVEMRAQLIRASRGRELHAMRLPFWSRIEINSVLNMIRNFGPTVHPGEINDEDLLGRLAMLSKTANEVRRFTSEIWKLLRVRKSDSGDLLIPDDVTMMCAAPPAAVEQVIIPGKEVNDVLKRICINQRIRKAIDRLKEPGIPLDHLLQPAHSWVTLGDVLRLLRGLVKYGCDELRHILLEPSYGFYEHLTEEDKRWLRVHDQKLHITQTQLPDFLLSDVRIYHFLNELTGSPVAKRLENMNPIDLPPQLRSEPVQRPPPVVPPPKPAAPPPIQPVQAQPPPPMSMPNLPIEPPAPSLHEGSMFGINISEVTGLLPDFLKPAPAFPYQQFQFPTGPLPKPEN